MVLDPKIVFDQKHSRFAAAILFSIQGWRIPATVWVNFQENKVLRSSTLISGGKSVFCAHRRRIMRRNISRCFPCPMT
jgi:hypothetical protein